MIYYSWKDPNCLFRTSPITKLKVLPTLSRWGTQKRLEGEQLLELELIDMLLTDEDDWRWSCFVCTLYIWVYTYIYNTYCIFINFINIHKKLYTLSYLIYYSIFFCSRFPTLNRILLLQVEIYIWFEFM